MPQTQTHQSMKKNFEMLVLDDSSLSPHVLNQMV